MQIPVVIAIILLTGGLSLALPSKEERQTRKNDRIEYRLAKKRNKQAKKMQKAEYIFAQKNSEISTSGTNED